MVDRFSATRWYRGNLSRVGFNAFLFENSGIEINFVMATIVLLGLTIFILWLMSSHYKGIRLIQKFKNLLVNSLFLIFGFYAWDYFLVGFNDFFHLTKHLQEYGSPSIDLDKTSNDFNKKTLLVNSVSNYIIIVVFNYILLKLYTYKEVETRSVFEGILHEMKFDSVKSRENLLAKNPDLKTIPIIVEHYNLLFFLFLELSAIIIIAMPSSGIFQITLVTLAFLLYTIMALYYQIKLKFFKNKFFYVMRIL